MDGLPGPARFFFIGGLEMQPLVVISDLAQGGAEQVTATFLRTLAEEGLPVPVCTVTNRRDGPLADELSLAGVPRYDLGAKRLLDPVALFKLVRLIRTGGFDLIHAHGQDASILAWWAKLFCNHSLVITRHVMGEPGRTLLEKGRSRLALKAISEADATVAVSRAVADRLTAIAPDSAGHVRTIPNGIDLDRFDPEQLRRFRPTLRQILRAEETDPLILFPAVLRPGKGHDVLLEAVPKVLMAFPGARFALAGEGELRGRLEDMAAHLGPAIRFLGNRNDIPALMDSADLVVLPSLSEALPTVAMEAAAAGRPVVASCVGGVPEIVADGHSGCLVAPGDPDALATAIVDLMADPELRAKYGASARQRAMERFGMASQVARTMDLWGEVGAGRRVEA